MCDICKQEEQFKKLLVDEVADADSSDSDGNNEDIDEYMW